MVKIPKPYNLFGPTNKISRVFICGKITGDGNYRDKFNRAETKLRFAGFAVMNPAILPSDGFEHDQYMKITLAMLSVCDALFYLEDWVESAGAQVEIEEATRMGMAVLSYVQWHDEYMRRLFNGKQADIR